MSNLHPLVVANWKMNTTLADAMIIGEAVKDALEDIAHIEVILAPPAIWLYPLAEHITRHPLRHLHLAAQNIHQEIDGPYTGEISAKMVKSLASYVLVGHSERGQFGETPEISAEKVKLALETGLKPIVFVGEQDKQDSLETVSLLLDKLLSKISQKDYESIILVYEPVWAISTNTNLTPPTSHEIERVIGEMRKKVGGQTPILYGGSVNTKNIHEIMSGELINGVVVGAASLKTKEFLDIIKSTANR